MFDIFVSGGDLDHSQQIMVSKFEQEPSSYFYEDPTSSICVILLTNREVNSHEYLLCIGDNLCISLKIEDNNDQTTNPLMPILQISNVHHLENIGKVHCSFAIKKLLEAFTKIICLLPAFKIL